MAYAYLKVFVDGKHIRTFGGNNSDVVSLYKHYKICDYEKLKNKYKISLYKKGYIS